MVEARVIVHSDLRYGVHQEGEPRTATVGTFRRRRSCIRNRQAEQEECRTEPASLFTERPSWTVSPAEVVQTRATDRVNALLLISYLQGPAKGVK
jgi:hypothetical protein